MEKSEGLVLSWLDWWALGSTVVSTLLVGWYASRRQQGGVTWTEYLLMGRQLTMPLFVATLVATWYGDILGVTQIAFQYGIYNFITQGLFWYLSYIAFALMMAKYVRKMQVRSFPELFTKLVGQGPGKITALMIFFKTLPVTYAIGMGIFLKTLFPLSFVMAVALGLILVIAYTMFAGFRAIVFSDFLQAIFMYCGILAVVGVSWFKFGGINYLLAHCPPSHFSICSNFSILDTLVWLFIAFSTTFLNPTFYQRSLAAATDRIAIHGIYISIGCWVIFDLLTTLMGLYARATLPHVPPLNAALQYALQILPTGLKGLFLGAILATILSTLDSFLFISHTTLSYDLRLMGRQTSFWGRLCSLLLTSIITFCIALYFEGNFEPAWRMLKGIFSGCIFPTLMVSYCRPRVVTTALFTSICVSVLVSVVMWTVYKPLPIDGFYVGQFVGWTVLVVGLLGIKLLKER